MTENFPQFKVSATCTEGHSQSVQLLGQGRLEVNRWAGLMDGTSPFYIRSPIGDPQSLIGKCGICGGQIKCSVEELERDAEETLAPTIRFGDCE
jgi:hypothetical protein